MTLTTDDYSGSDSDNGFDEDMEAFRKACILTGKNPNDLLQSTVVTPTIPTTSENSQEDSDSDSSSSEDDLDILRGLRQRFSFDEEPQPLCTILPDECDDDFQLLRSIEQRFAQYNATSVSSRQQHEQVSATNIDSEKISSNNLFVESTNNLEGFTDCVDASTDKVCVEDPPSDSFEWRDLEADLDRSSSFPKSAHAFIDAKNKNKLCQKFIREKMMRIETMMEENKKLRGRIKILKDFQVSCRRGTGRALSRKRDGRVQLISVPKLRANAKVDVKNPSALYYGPAENSQVANYRLALQRFPLALSRAKWSKVEKENLAKGIKQQLQELLFQKSVDIFSGADGDASAFDRAVVSIRDHDISSKKIRLFLPKVNWEQVASMYVMGRTGTECESRWLNCEDPLISKNSWTKLEDKSLLHIVQQRGISNWIEIAVSLGINKTPFQCLARYQRSLNASILKREWSEDEDDKLRAAVETYGESNWQVVASAVGGRTGTQCSNRWMKSLNPIRHRVGRWSLDEDKRLKIAVMLFGAKNWHKIAQFIPGRTQVQCRERWFNCLDPTLNKSKWTEEEDLKLRAAISDHGYTSWSKVAACLAPRTDSQCRRRWIYLYPEEAYLCKVTNKIKSKALISNFVDRESERPALGPSDFVPLSIGSVPESEIGGHSRKRKRKRRPPPEQNENEPPSGCVPTRRSKRLMNGSCVPSDKILRLNDSDEIGEDDLSMEKREKRRPSSVNEKPAALRRSTRNLSLSCPDEVPVPIINSEEVRTFRRDKSKKMATKKKMTCRLQKMKSSIREKPEETNSLSEVDGIIMPGREKLRPKRNESASPTCIEVAEFTVEEEAQEINEFSQVEASGDDDELFMSKIWKMKKRRKNPGAIPRQSDDFDVEENECSDIMKKRKSIEPYSCTTSPDLPDLIERLPVNEERPLRCSTPEIIDCFKSRSSGEPRPSRCKKSKAKDKARPQKENKIEEDENYDITLVSFLEQRRKCRKHVLGSPRSKLDANSDIVELSRNLLLPPRCPSAGIEKNQNPDNGCELECLIQKPETKEEDAITLARWQSKLRKRKMMQRNPL